jgi:hypothetical protein
MSSLKHQTNENKAIFLLDSKYHMRRGYPVTDTRSRRAFSYRLRSLNVKQNHRFLTVGWEHLQKLTKGIECGRAYRSKQALVINIQESNL